MEWRTPLGEDFMTDQKFIVPARTVASRIVDDLAMILDPSVDSLQRLNEVGSFIWARIMERRHTAPMIREAMVDEFEVNDEQAAADLSVFLAKLQERNLITYTAN
jgi:hypothetical protein